MTLQELRQRLLEKGRWGLCDKRPEKPAATRSIPVVPTDGKKGLKHSFTVSVWKEFRQHHVETNADVRGRRVARKLLTRLARRANKAILTEAVVDL